MARQAACFLCVLHWVCLQAVDKFLHAKGKLDGNGAPPLNDIMEALHSLTTVRANLAVGLSSGESACQVLQHQVTDCVQDSAIRHPPLTCHLHRFWLDPYMLHKGSLSWSQASGLPDVAVLANLRVHM